jgi:hypothetical protein
VATHVIGTAGVFFTFPSHRFSRALAIFPPGRFTFSCQAHVVDYRRALSLTNMPPKLLKPTMTSKKPTAVDCSGDNGVPEATAAADAKEEIRQDDVGRVGGHPHLLVVCDGGTPGAAHQE